MKTGTRVLMFGWEFPPCNSGGLGVACLGLTRALFQLGAIVTFVLPKRMNVLSSFARILFADVSLPSVQSENFISGYITPEGYKKLRAFENNFYSNNLFDEVICYSLRARKIAREEEFDVIHAHDWLSFPAGIEAKRVSGKPLVVHVHATEFDRTGGKTINKDVYNIERRGMEYADHIIAVSQYTKNILVNNYGVSANKVEVVYNGINTDEYPHDNKNSSKIFQLKKDGKQIVLFVGRITVQKGPDYFVAAAKKVLEKNQNVIFVVCGSGDMEGQIMNQAAFLQISDKIVFTGFVRNDELNDIYKAADVYVMPSISEPFGITPLESIANGTPVIISKQSGVSEIIRHSLQVDFWDVDELANKILCVLKYPSLKECMRDNSLMEILGFSWKKAAERCLLVYEKVKKILKNA